MTDLEKLSIDTLRLLAVDQVQKANSGHPGAPMACAPIAYLLYRKYMKHDPSDPLWIDRDRFVLSNGHASALLYGALHLSGYDLPMSQLESFRQWGSHTPGHPEYGETPGVEVTTGPLGQGLAMAVGLAIAEKHMAAVYNRPDVKLFDHHTYVLCGDGDLMEGISHEACSLAGTLKLNKLIVFYDDNLISLDGPTDLSYTEDVTMRFQAYGWNVLSVGDGEDLNALEAAINKAKEETERPTLIRVRTIIGIGSPKQGTKNVHGEPLGVEGTKAAKAYYGFDPEKSFVVPEEAGKHWLEAVEKGKKAHEEWNKVQKAYEEKYPAEAKEVQTAIHAKLPEGWSKDIKPFGVEKAMATRSAGGVVLDAIGKSVPNVIGGAADLTSSTKTIFKDSPNFHLDPKGRNIFFGVREFGMAAAVNGMAAHGGLIPYGSTFFTFSDYMRNAIRLAALMSTHSLFIFTHDSVGLGEDGPTHQPIEHLMSLRSIPQLTDFRPADANETRACWLLAMERTSASWMALSRQDLPVLDEAKYNVEAGVRKGAYVLQGDKDANLIVVATGSEVSLAMKAVPELEKAGFKVKVVSMPSWKIFEEQSEEYKMSIFPHGVPKISVEAGATEGWWKYIGRDGVAVGLDRFGASAPGPLVMEKLGISVAGIVEAAKKASKK